MYPRTATGPTFTLNDLSDRGVPLSAALNIGASIPRRDGALGTSEQGVYYSPRGHHVGASLWKYFLVWHRSILLLQ